MKSLLAKSFVFNIINLFFSFIITVLLARYLTVSERGDFALYFSLYLFSLPLVQYGCKQTIGSINKQSKFTLKAITSTAYAISFTLFVTVSLSYFTICWLEIFEVDGMHLGLTLVLLLLSTIYSINNGVQLSEGDALNVNYLTMLQGSITLLLMLLFITAFNLSISLVLVAYIIGFSVVLSIQIFSQLPLFSLSSIKTELTLKVLNVGLFVTLSSFLLVLNYRLDLFIIGDLLDKESVAIYSIAVNLSDICWKIPSTLGLVLFSKLVSTGVSGKEKKFISFSIILPCMIAALFVYIGGKDFILFFYGQDYSDSYQVTRVLLLSVVFLSMFKIHYLELSAQSKVFPLLIVILLGVVVNIIANYILIPIIGVTGAAYSTVISYLFMFLLVKYVVMLVEIKYES
ncbi:polysaccharide biosynthesis C-terminal domain-containing protein [Vibrio astriarenae]